MNVIPASEQRLGQSQACAGAILQKQQEGRKYYRGVYATFRNGYILSFDAEAASEDKLNKLLAGIVSFAK